MGVSRRMVTEAKEDPRNPLWTHGLVVHLCVGLPLPLLARQVRWEVASATGTLEGIVFGDGYGFHHRFSLRIRCGRGVTTVVSDIARNDG